MPHRNDKEALLLVSAMPARAAHYARNAANIAKKTTGLEDSLIRLLSLVLVHVSDSKKEEGHVGEAKQGAEYDRGLEGA